MPARFPREEQRRSLSAACGAAPLASPPRAPAAADGPSREPDGGGADARVPADEPVAGAAARAPRPKDPRHVRAVPTNAQVKVERALELFNDSDHPRTIAGLARTLGDPWVSARPMTEAPSAVSLVVAWELSWYRYRVDLGDESDPVLMLDKGEEIDRARRVPARVERGARRERASAGRIAASSDGGSGG